MGVPGFTMDLASVTKTSVTYYGLLINRVVMPCPDNCSGRNGLSPLRRRAGRQRQISGTDRPFQ